ncbi:MAG: 4Fe-4S binding protein [Chloroflexota bacterium]
MPKPKAMVDFNKCHPERCDHGLCVAVDACQLHVLQQEAPYEPPMPNPNLCKGCGDCVRACPLKAMVLM